MTRKIRTSIIPSEQQFYRLRNVSEDLDLSAICCFAATGFFLAEDTYWKNLKVLQPGTEYLIDSDGYLQDSKTVFKWHYNPIHRPFTTVVEEFTQLFESTINSQIGDKKIILPLSGGLDSRTQATALFQLKKNVQAYSYEFENGYPETKIAQKISKKCGFNFIKLKVPNSYLWDVIDDLYGINKGYSEFIYCRQMAFLDDYENMGDIFSLGHWGDVLFDDMKIPDDLSFEQQIFMLYHKIVKRGGEELACRLWRSFNLEGNFKDYLYSRLEALLNKIDIPENANAQIRAFKSMYWAPRWTSINLSIFRAKHPIALPYYDDDICKFICEVPESYLANRAIQIHYIRNRNPNLAKITWQQHRPFNLYNFHYNKIPYSLPYRITNKLKRLINAKRGNPYVQRNWELQFLGEKNRKKLEHFIAKDNLVPAEISEYFFRKFTSPNYLDFAHPMSILLTLSVWSQHQRIFQKS